jgi:ATP-binding cassette subfamily B protein
VSAPAARAADEPTAVAPDARLLRRLLGWLRPYRLLASGAVVVLLAGAVIQLAGPLLTQRALDVAVPNRDAGLLTTLALLYLAALLAELAIEYAQTLLTTRIGQRVMFDLRSAIFRHLQRLGIPYFDAHPVGRLMTRVTSDVETLNELFSSGVVTVFGDVFTLVAIMLLMLVTDWRLALVTFATIPLMWLVARFFRAGVRRAFRDIRTRLAALNAYLQEQLGGMRVTQLFGRERAAAQRFQALNDAHLEAHLRSITLYALFFPAVELLTAIAVALLLWYGGLRHLDGTLTVGTLAAFIQLVRRFFQPLQDLSEKFNLLQSAMASSERIFALLDHAPEAASAAPAAAHLPVGGRGEVRFEGVWFRYAADGPWVLRDVSFVAAPGETVALVGHTGAGKSTIVSLLLRFYDPERGRILLDGVDIRTVPVAELRRRIGYVQQDLFLFTGDLARNLVLDGDVPLERARTAAADVGADRVIARLPDGWAHQLGERGRNLSVGERQLLAFARALARDPAILVLDEATSSVDAEAEAQIQAALDRLMTGRTSLVVAHRLSTIVHADVILVLHHGEIRERGTHRDLRARDGLYRRLHALQFGGTEPTAAAS